MKRFALVHFLVLVILAAMVGITSAASYRWDGPTTYTDGSAIPAAKISQIVYRAYIGDSSTGPWVLDFTTSAGVTNAVLSDPPPGGTLWYTVDAFLDGVPSAKAAAVSKTVPFQVPAAPTGLTPQ
jgi:hypothetical protein